MGGDGVADRGVEPVEDLVGEGLIGGDVPRLVESQPLHQGLEHLGVGAALAHAGHRGSAALQHEGAVASGQLGMLHERGRREHDISVVRRVGHHRVEHHREQVFAA